jgi:hypothetical protein
MAETKTTKSKKKSLFTGEEMVTIKLPLTRTEKDDVWVAVNGKSMQIKRGVEVEVPKCIYEVLQHKEEMLMQAIEFESNATGKADDSELN